MKTKVIFIAALTFAFFYGCSSGSMDSNTKNTAATEEMGKAEYESSSATDESMDKDMAMDQSKEKAEDPGAILAQDREVFAIEENETDTTVFGKKLRMKKIIRTASVRFKVKNVEESTGEIETLSRKFGGYVASSDLRSVVYHSKRVELSSDSMLLVKEVEMNSQIVIRVPYMFYDSVLNYLSKMAIYVDYRTLQTTDMTSSFLRNRLKAESKKKYEDRINNAVDNRGGNLEDIVNAETSAAYLSDQAIDNKIANFEIQDQIDFSTITLSVYQPTEVVEEQVKNIDISVYNPGLDVRLKKAVVFGWKMLKGLLVGLVYIWPLLLLAAIAYYILRFFMKKSAKKKEMKS